MEVIDVFFAMLEDGKLDIITDSFAGELIVLLIISNFFTWKSLYKIKHELRENTIRDEEREKRI